MYINFGPSKKDLYKIILLLICLLFAFRGFVKADSYWGSYGVDFGGVWGSNIQNNGYYETIALSVNLNNGSSIGSYAINHGDLLSNKIVTFVFYSSDINVTNIHIVNNAGNSYACEIYGDSYSNNGLHSYNVICPYVGELTWNGTSIKFATTYTSINGTILFGLSQINYFDSQAVAISETANNTNQINNTINDSSIDQNSANDFTSDSAFQDFNGLDAIIKAPLNFIQSLTSSTCSNINLTIPYIDAEVSLPCMSSVYNKALGQQLVNLIALVINGVILYRYCLKILQIVKDAKNPNKDGLEVLDL